MKITLELDAVEAHLILGPIGDAQIRETRTAARSKGSDQEAASIRASVLGRVATRIVDELIPDPRTVILREEIELGML